MIETILKWIRSVFEDDNDKLQKLFILLEADLYNS